MGSEQLRGGSVVMTDAGAEDAAELADDELLDQWHAGIVPIPTPQQPGSSLQPNAAWAVNGLHAAARSPSEQLSLATNGLQIGTPAGAASVAEAGGAAADQQPQEQQRGRRGEVRDFVSEHMHTSQVSTAYASTSWQLGLSGSQLCGQLGAPTMS